MRARTRVAFRSLIALRPSRDAEPTQYLADASGKWPTRGVLCGEPIWNEYSDGDGDELVTNGRDISDEPITPD